MAKKVTRQYLFQLEVTTLLGALIKAGFVNIKSMSQKDSEKVILGFKSKRTKLALAHIVRRIHAHINDIDLWLSNRLRKMIDVAVNDLPETLLGKIKVARNPQRPPKLKHGSKSKKKGKKGRKVSAKTLEWANSDQNLSNLKKARAARLSKKAKVPSVSEAKAAIANLRKGGVSANGLAALEKEVKNIGKKVNVIYKALGL